MLPEAPEPVLPVPLVELPYCFWHFSRSWPIRPTHWLGTEELPDVDAPVSPVALPEVLEPVLEPVAPLVDVPVPAEPPALVPPALPAPDCAHDALATPTRAAATAAAIVLTITFESPWSVEEVLQRAELQEQCLPRCSFDSTGENARLGRCAHDQNSPHTVSWRCHHGRATAHCLPAERALLPAERHASFAGAEPRALLGRRVLDRARRGALPLRR